MTEKEHNSKKVSKIGNFFDKYENYLFNVKFFLIIAVIVSAILAIVLLCIGAWDAFLIIEELVIHNIDTEEFYVKTLSIADIFLFAMVMMIFSLGSYNLFISKLDNIAKDSIHNDSITPDWLQVKDFGELKELFIKVIILILAISFLKKISMVEDFNNLKEVVSLLIFPISILLIALSLKFMSDK